MKLARRCNICKMVGLQSDTLETAVAIHSTENLPSIFEVLAQENLKSSLRPAFEYLVKVCDTVKLC